MPVFLVTCGPTGVGKTHHMQRLIKKYPRLCTPVLSVTTRASRGPEDEAWYRFIDPSRMSDVEPDDIVSRAVFRGEQYLLLRSEIDRALARAPIAFMAIIPSVVLLLRQKQIEHSLICCRIGDGSVYERHLQQRGYQGEALTREREEGLAFSYPVPDPAWPQFDVFLDDDQTADGCFDRAVERVAGPLPAFEG